ncbi:HAD-IIB family hydrolase [Colwelliaceae bacterium BS250]
MDKQYIISTDLDGTLLDHNTYQFHKAAPALEFCDESAVPVIFNTSKTFSETEKLCKQLNNNHPFIIENGSALYIPKDYFDLPEQSSIPKYDAGAYWLFKFGLNKTQILSQLATFSANKKYQYAGFSTISTQELARKSGLTLEQAACARERQYSEPLEWLDTPEKLEEFRKQLELYALNCIKGGRYIHIIGQTNKAKPLLFLKELYKQKFSSLQTLIALGDSDNDKDMLDCADIAIVIESPAHQNPVIETHPHLIRSRYQGPSGWNDSIMSLLQPTSLVS